MVWPATRTFDIELYDEVRALVEYAGFTIIDHFLFQGIPLFYVSLPKSSKTAFLWLMNKLKPYGLYPTLRKRGDRYELKILMKSTAKPRFASTPIIVGLLAITLVAIFYAGYSQSIELARLHGLEIKPVFGGLAYTAAMMAVLATHEVGHMIASKIHGVEATPPIFIPGPPPFGTFGAVIQQKSLAPNKDALFDIGIAGPLAGFVASLVVTVIGIQYSVIKPVVSPIQMEGATPAPLIYSIITNLVMRPPPGLILIIPHPVAFAGWIGMIITMLNLIPAGMLDGGHIARCFMKPVHQNILAFVAIAVVAFQGYVAMAILALLMALMQRHPGPLDDVSPVAKWRKVLALAPIAIFILCLPI